LKIEEKTLDETGEFIESNDQMEMEVIVFRVKVRE
jgi:hypothetical protein